MRYGGAPEQFETGELERAEPVLALVREHHKDPTVGRRRLGEQRIPEPALGDDAPPLGLHHLERAALRVEDGVAVPDRRGGRAVVLGMQLPRQLTRVGIEGVEVVSAESAADQDAVAGDRGSGHTTAGGQPDTPAR